MSATRSSHPYTEAGMPLFFIFREYRFDILSIEYFTHSIVVQISATTIKHFLDIRQLNCISCVSYSTSLTARLVVRVNSEL